MLEKDKDDFDLEKEDFLSSDSFEVKFPNDLEAIYDVPVAVSVVLGRASMPINKLLRLGRGAVVELDRKIGDPIDILVNNRLIARGEVVMVDETRLGVTMTEIVKSEK